MSNADIKQHISSAERAKWNKVVDDFAAHLGSGGVVNHALGNGVVPGFSTHDFTVLLKQKLDAIQEGALNNPHPTTHPWTMITGLANLANTANWTDIVSRPQRILDVENGVADAATVSGGIRVTVGAEPANPTNNKELWFDLTAMLIKVRVSGAWQAMGAVYR